MVRRKLVQQGTNTLMVSMPANWIKKHGLAKGNEVSLEQVEDTIVVMPGVSKISREATITLVGEHESTIRTMITNVYRIGYDRITVRFSNNKQFEVLSDIVKTRLIGFDIMRKDKSQCIVESITEPSPEQFDGIMRKVFQNIGLLFDVTRQRLEGKETSEDVDEIEERIQKYDNYCRRTIAKRIVHQQKSELFWSFVALLIHGQREIYRVNRYLKKEAQPKAVLELFDIATELFTLTESAYMRRELAPLFKTHDIENNLSSKGLALLDRPGIDKRVVFQIVIGMRQLYLSNSPMMGMLL